MTKSPPSQRPGNAGRQAADNGRRCAVHLGSHPYFHDFVETALGQTFSVVATPVKGEGRVYRLMSAEPPSRPETRKWETAQAYEKLLISLNRAVLTGDIPDGYGEVKPLSDGIRLPGGFLLPPESPGGRPAACRSL